MNDHEDSTDFDRNELSELAARLRELPAEMPPARDLWPAISERTVGAERTLERRRPRRFLGRPRLAIAAGLALAFLGGWWLARLRPSPVPLVNPPFVAAAAYQQADAALTAVRDQLRREVEARGSNLPPDLARLVAENLATIDRAIAEIETALAAEPGNSELARAWVDYRQREISLLRRVNQVAARL